jgi:tetratricopeptide (TPR) repeat protein
MEQLEKIIKYLDGEVIGDEKQAFEKKLEGDVSLQEKLKLVKDIDATLSDENLNSFVTKIQQIQSSVTNKKTDVKEKTNTAIILKRRFLSAAAVLLIMAISSIFYLNLAGPRNERIYNQFYQKYESSLITRSDNSETSDLIAAIQLYDKGNYQGAIARLTNLLQKDNSNTTAHFFIGLSYMETKTYEKAITNFNVIMTERDTAFIEHAEWYTALCYVQTNRIKQASELLKQITESNSYYKIKAVDLLKKL